MILKEKQQDKELKLTLNTKYFAVRKSERRLYLIIHCFSSACPVQGQIQGLEPILAAIERG